MAGPVLRNKLPESVKGDMLILMLPLVQVGHNVLFYATEQPVRMALLNSALLHGEWSRVVHLER